MQVLFELLRFGERLRPSRLYSKQFHHWERCGRPVWNKQSQALRGPPRARRRNRGVLRRRGVSERANFFVPVEAFYSTLPQRARNKLDEGSQPCPVVGLQKTGELSKSRNQENDCERHSSSVFSTFLLRTQQRRGLRRHSVGKRLSGVVFYIRRKTFAERQRPRSF